MKKASPALIAAAFLLALLPAAASPATPKTQVLITSFNVEHIAADGGRVAAVTTTKSLNTCDRIVIWEPATRKSSHIRTSVNCQTASAANNVPEIALAGKRVAWLEAAGGNDLYLTLVSHTLGHKKSASVFETTNGNGAAGDSSGGYVQNLFGEGSLLAFNTWSECIAVPSDFDWEDVFDRCPAPPPDEEAVTMFNDQELLTIVNGKAAEIASAPDAAATGLKTMFLTVVAVDAGRIVIQQPDGSVTIYTASGTASPKIPIPSGRFAGFALQGSQLATLRDGSLELYDTSTGELVKTLSVPSGSVLRDLQSGLAVYVSGRKVHVLRLSDGKSATFLPPGTGAVDAQIESSGLFYSYNLASRPERGRIAFVPFAQVLKKLG